MIVYPVLYYYIQELINGTHSTVAFNGVDLVDMVRLGEVVV